MSGRRTKVLKKLFLTMFGKTPTTSEFRRYKKEWLMTRSVPKTFSVISGLRGTYQTPLLESVLPVEKRLFTEKMLMAGSTTGSFLGTTSVKQSSHGVKRASFFSIFTGVLNWLNLKKAWVVSKLKNKWRKSGKK